MIVKVISSLGSSRVCLESRLGIFSAKWVGDGSPVIDKEYFVELDSSYILTSNDIVLSPDESSRIIEENNKIVITGLLSEYSDSCLTLVMNDSILELLVEKNETINNLLKKYITVFLPNIEAYDEHII